MTSFIHYQKRKNTELFKTLEKETLLRPQNYIPLYDRFFSLNEANWNQINLNQKWNIHQVKQQRDEFGVFSCLLKEAEKAEHSEKKKKPGKEKTIDIFVKMAPLLDPFKFLIGKYAGEPDAFFELPVYRPLPLKTPIYDVNNAAYVDGFFSFLTSQLLNEYRFVHGLDYYGSFLAVKNRFPVNIFDDVEYLIESDYFLRNKNVAFEVEDYDYLFDDAGSELDPDGGPYSKKKRRGVLRIGEEKSALTDVVELSADEEEEKGFITLEEVSDLENVVQSPLELTSLDKTSLKSHSTCSSRTSHTNESFVKESNNESDGDQEDEEKPSEDDEEEDEEDDDERIHAYIPSFPVQMICMEKCEDTLDHLLLERDLSEIEWLSALMQIIMTLAAYQKTFSFTHNDLHTNNIMYQRTEKEFLYYIFEGRSYRVPTFGLVFKIIDFGRAIYKFDGKLFCSNSFQAGNDAAKQYNTEPYFNEKKPRLDPNPSFDLTRLACSLYDYVIEDDRKKPETIIEKLIVDWCTDDKGINLLYKSNGEDRYPEFKLYKMIARCVHRHTPKNQLERPEFKAFLIDAETIPKKEKVVNIDDIPVLV